MEIIEVKVTEKNKKKTIFLDIGHNFFLTIFLDKFILGDSNIPNRILQINVLHDIYGVKVIKVFDLPQGVWVIYSDTSRHYDKILFHIRYTRSGKKSQLCRNFWKIFESHINIRQSTVSSR